MPTAIVCCGISASGKSTFVNTLDGYLELNRDAMRRIACDVSDDKNLWSVYKFNNKIEDAISEILNRAAIDAFAENKNIVDSNTNIDPTRAVEFYKNIGFDVQVKHFRIDVSEAIKRDINRRDTVGSAVIYKQYYRYCEIHGSQYPRHQHHDGLRKAVIVDIDGTLMHMGNRGAFDWDRVGEDTPDSQVVEIIKLLKMSGYAIIVLSGRDSCCRDLTIKSLECAGIPFDHVFMRAANDHRKDSIIKNEIFERYIEGNYNVKYVFDDRPQVVRMWIEKGLKTFVVGNPFIEF